MAPRLYFAGCGLDGGTGHAVGRRLLDRLYRENIGGDLPEIRIAAGGKPYFIDAGWHFSLTHTKRHAFCVLCDCPVGVDAEEADRRVDPRLADKILSPFERRQYDSAGDPRRALLTFWVLKEAAAKRTGEGIRAYPNHTRFRLGDSRVIETMGCLVAIITQEDREYAF